MLLSIIWFNKYRVIRKLGQGGCSEVFLVLHCTLNTYRAVKRIPREQTARLWKQETHILKILKHPNIPIIYDIEEDDSYFYIIEEYIEGESLKAYRFNREVLSEDEIASYLLQLCEVFQFLHSLEPPILYLDLKPENLLLQDGIIKLVDFGTATFFCPGSSEPIQYGTKGYAAPEQYTSSRVDARTDIYAIGAVLYFLLTGRTYSGKRKDLYAPLQDLDCSKKIQRILQKCLAYFPVQRYQTITALQKEIATNTSHNNNAVIGLVGAASGVGVTHIGILLAEYAARRGNQKVILVEYNTHGDFKRMKERLFRESKEVFIRKGVQYIDNADKQELEKLIGESKLVLIDFGENLIGKSQELTWCTQKVLVGTHALWQEDAMNQKMSIFSDEEWTHLYNFDSEGLGYCPIAAALNKNAEHVLKHIITKN